MVMLKFKMVNKQQSVQTSLLVIIIFTLKTFFFVGNMIPVQALHKEEQLMDNYDDLQEFADSVKDGDEEIESIPLEWMISTDTYDDADESLQDCIDSAKVGDNLADNEVVQCIEDVNFFKNKYSPNSSVPIIAISATTGTSAATGTNNISTIGADDEQNNLINELVKTGKFTEDEAKELVTKVMKNGTNEGNVTDGLNVPEANLTANVPEANLTANVPEANLTANVPEANLTANVPEANLTANVPEANLTANPESNLTANVPEANLT